MFEDSLMESGGKIKSKSRYWMIATFIFNGLILIAMILVPLLYPEALPRTSLMASLSAPPPPPPPPPPPAPKVKVIPITHEIDQGLHAPTKIPKDINMVKDAPPPPGMGVAGVNGLAGSPGGVFGGMMGNHGPAIHVAPPKPTGPIRISAGVVAGNRIAFVEPQYPPIAKIAHMSGTVVLRAIISKTGSVVNLEIASSTNPMFNNAAMEAVKQWRYKPYLLNNQPTDVDTTITVNFALNGG